MSRPNGRRILWVWGANGRRILWVWGAEALKLPNEERVELACSLLESVEADDDDARSQSRKSWADAWAAEVNKRLAAMDAGEPGIPAAEALAALRRK